MDKANKRIIQIDQKTGEELQGTVVYFAPKRRIYPKGYITMSQEGLRAIYENDAIGKPELKVLLLLLSEMTYENLIPYTQSAFAKRHDLDRSVVNRCWNNLVDENILIFYYKEGSNKFYVVNSEYAWKGKLRNYRKTHDDIEVPAITEFVEGVAADDNSDDEDTLVI